MTGKKVAAQKKVVANLPRIRIRAPPRNLFLVMNSLTDEKKQAIKDIGFESIFDFPINVIPTKLGYWVLENFDAAKCALKVNDESIPITKETVHEILGVPMGEIEIKPLEATTSDDKRTREWRKQFVETGKIRIYVTDVVNTMIQQTDSGTFFKLNFLVLFVTIMAEGIKCNTVNQKFLPCITNEEDIVKMDWCGYILECLKRTKVEWNRKSHYNGPLVFLSVLYAKSIKSKTEGFVDIIPSIKQWNSEGLQKIETEEISNGRLGPINKKRKRNQEKQNGNAELKTIKRKTEAMELKTEKRKHVKKGKKLNFEKIEEEDEEEEEEQEREEETEYEDESEDSNFISSPVEYKQQRKKIIGRKMAARRKVVANLPRIRIRAPPKNLFLVMNSLTDEKKKAIMDIGFESIIDFPINNVPTKLGYWVLENFNATKCTLKVNDESIPITKETVHEILGVPMGEIEIKPLEATTSDDKRTREWRKQFAETGKIRIYVTDVVNTMIQQTDSGTFFKQNFLVLFVTTMAEGIKCNTANQKFLPCIKKEEDIINMDWCSYILECLKRTKMEWNRESHYNGPLVFLLVLYAKSIKLKTEGYEDIIPSIKHWNSESLQKIENEEISNGRFGQRNDRKWKKNKEKQDGNVKLKTTKEKKETIELKTKKRKRVAKEKDKQSNGSLGQRNDKKRKKNKEKQDGNLNLKTTKEKKETTELKTKKRKHVAKEKDVQNDEDEDSDEPLESRKKSRAKQKERKSVHTNDGQERMDKSFNDNESIQNLSDKGVAFGKQIKPTIKEEMRKALMTKIRTMNQIGKEIDGMLEKALDENPDDDEFNDMWRQINQTVTPLGKGKTHSC